MQSRAEQPVNPEYRSQFFKLCDMAAATVNKTNNRAPFFVDSYAVRALCVAYDMTGEKKYLDACRKWSEQMVKYQEQMTPPGAYYMHYNRKPGQTNGEWYAADSSSIAMALVATAVRCQGDERERLMNSTKKFADLVLNNYLMPDGGISDGLWKESTNSWWCSSGLFGSFMFVLYSNTGDERYLNAGLEVVDWMNHCDLVKDQPFPLWQQGPAMTFYVMELYSAGWPYLTNDVARAKVAQARVQWCLDWMLEKQQAPLQKKMFLPLRAPRTLTKLQHPHLETMQGKWAISTGWGMKFGGLPFHEYIFSQRLPEDGKLTIAGDEELNLVAKYVFARKLSFNQLTAFMMMSYAERLDPGDIYRTVK